MKTKSMPNSEKWAIRDSDWSAALDRSGKNIENQMSTIIVIFQNVIKYKIICIHQYISFHIHTIQTFIERAINVGDEIFVDYGYDTDGSDWHPSW